MQQSDVWTGRRLLEFLAKLSPEDLNKDVNLAGCDCYGYCRAAAVADEIFLGRDAVVFDFLQELEAR